MGVQVLMVGSPLLPVRTQTILLDRIFCGISFGADHLVHTVVGTRCHHIVLYQNGVSLFGSYHRHSLISVLEFLGIVPALLPQLLAYDRTGFHRGKSLHTVAAVNIHHLADGTEAVCRIKISLVLRIEVEAPGVPVLVPELVETVMIGPLGMDDLAEKPLLSHVQGRELEEIIDAVLQHHAMQTLAFRHIDEGPDFVEGRGRRYLYRHVLAMLHCIESHGRMSLPVRSDVH